MDMPAWNLPGKEVPRCLREIWLAFHQQELCRDLDSLFLFWSDRMEVWCVVDEEKSYNKFSELIGERNAREQVDLYPTRPPEPKKSREEEGPPPGLWHNEELRIYFQDPGERLAARPFSPRPPAVEPPADPFLKRRLVFFGEQLQEKSTRMKRLAADLPLLAWAAFDGESPEDLRSPAAAACVNHAREVEKNAERLAEDLSRAFPRTDRQDWKEAAAGKQLLQSREAAANAAQISRVAEDLARRVYRFMYPDVHTVGLEDLRSPGLLRRLAELAAASAEFQRLLSAPPLA